jgi:hypothetical protein
MFLQLFDLRQVGKEVLEYKYAFIKIIEPYFIQKSMQVINDFFTGGSLAYKKGGSRSAAPFEYSLGSCPRRANLPLQVASP